MAKSGAAAVIIGNELLTAKIKDLNGPLLIERLRQIGMPLRSVTLVPDDVDTIVGAIAHARSRAAHVFTSGGIGPTHDDVTVRAVSLAMGRKVIRLPEMLEILRGHARGKPLPDEALRLADAPEGAELWTTPQLYLPVLTCDRIYMLPGVPQLFREQLEVVLSRLERRRVHIRVMYLSAFEPEIASALDRIALDLPHVAIGSYPNFDRDRDYTTKLTIEHEAPEPVADAVHRLEQNLPKGSILRIE